MNRQKASILNVLNSSLCTTFYNSNALIYEDDLLLPFLLFVFKKRLNFSF